MRSDATSLILSLGKGDPSASPHAEGRRFGSFCHDPIPGAESVKIRDYSAELYVAGQFADMGWNVYFPHRDQGFDFIVSKPRDGQDHLLRPVQVKGKYPQEGTSDRQTYGYIGQLSETHAEMVLAIPFYSKSVLRSPKFVAYMPHCEIRSHSKGSRCEPARFRNGEPEVRPGFKGFFGLDGLRLLEEPRWSVITAAKYEW